ncbi:pentapeptide repeat-containing protein [Labilithrix luteola]|nr:pentapeptide repeat-containing protein [Labilithrix luteola]
MTTFAVSTDFAQSKPLGQPCPNLDPHFRCSIHASLRERGYRGCTTYDCFGAGQHVSQITFDGIDWRDAPDVATSMVRVFPVVRALHEQMVLLREALGHPLDLRLRRELRDAFQRCADRTHLPARDLELLDVEPERRLVGNLLRRASLAVRTSAGHELRDYERKDFAGADLRGADLRGVNLRATTLLGADLSRADLGMTDLLGADLRGARLFGADLRRSLFVTEPQIATADGDGDTLLPDQIRRPAHWLVRLRRPR